jgi:hypothetical protein
MTEIDAIAVQHEGWPHAPQECWVGDFPCDVQTLLAEIATLRAALDGLVALPRWAMVGNLNDRHMDAVPDGDYIRLATLRAALATAKGTP